MVDCLLALSSFRSSVDRGVGGHLMEVQRWEYASKVYSPDIQWNLL